MEVVLFWFVGAFIAGAIAEKKGRSFLGVFAFSLLLSPVLGVPMALIMERNDKQIAKVKVAEGKGKVCPYCAEIVKPEATVCRYCQRDLPQQPTA